MKVQKKIDSKQEKINQNKNNPENVNFSGNNKKNK
jgi:hypothetical protein